MQNCEPTQTPEVDVAALREKYLFERDKRLRSEGQKQYLVTEGNFDQFYEDDPHTPVSPRDPIVEQIDVAVLGGGFCGLICAARLKQSGVSSMRIIEFGGDFGGAWYWNRYPGIQCDTDSYCYLPLLEETGYIPKEKYSYGQEVYDHCRRIGDHFGLYEHALFSTMVKAMEWDESLRRWRIRTNRGDEIQARFVVMAQGPFNKPKLPGIPGIHDFTGHVFHTARWDYEYTGGSMAGGLDKLGDKKVAVIGTGASGIGVIPHLAEGAEHLYVFQRTPTYIDHRPNTPTDREWVDSLVPGWQDERRRNFHRAAFKAFAPGQPDLVCDGWTEPMRNFQKRMDELGWPKLTPEQYMELRLEMDYRAMQRIRDRVDTIVEDPETAEALKAYYRFRCKRPGFSDTYLPTFNRSNVTLVDVAESKGVERITATGIVAKGVEYEVDCIVFASGFEITTDLDRRLGISPYAGTDGLSLYDHWGKGYRTLHGVTTDGFPNQFFTGFIQGGVTATTTAMFEQQADHIAYLVRHALEQGVTKVEPTADAVDDWCRVVKDTATDNSEFELECTPGYYNNEGETTNGKTTRSHLGEPYWPGFYELSDLLQAWRSTGELEGLVLERGAGNR